MESNQIRINLIAKRLSEVLLDGQWITNTNMKDIITDLDWEKATQQVNSYNSIALLIFHINYYLDGVLNVLNGGKLEIRDKYSYDMPPIESEEDWNNLRNQFMSNAESFVEKVKTLSDSDLENNFANAKYGTYQRNLDGMIEHAYYHLGQMALIKKTILTQ